jgi:hypothetical protein
MSHVYCIVNMLNPPLERINANDLAIGMLQQVVEHPASGQAFKTSDLQN